MALFLGRALIAIVAPPFRGRLLLEHMHFVGNRSLGIVCLTAGFTGMVLALQGYHALSRFGSDELVGPLVALSLTRELAPVLAALMVAARAGSAMAATIGNMRVTEQIDALRSMAVDPVHYLVSPRLLATVIVVPMLTALFSLVGIAAAYLLSVSVLRLDGGSFISGIRQRVEWIDVSAGIHKSIIFAFVIAWIATYRGFHAHGGAKGVGMATTSAVVNIAVLVLVGDYLMTALLF